MHLDIHSHSVCTNRLNLFTGRPLHVRNTLHECIRGMKACIEAHHTVEMQRDRPEPSAFELRGRQAVALRWNEVGLCQEITRDEQQKRRLRLS